VLAARGGYIVYPVPPSPMKFLISNKVKEWGKNQNFILFIRKYATSEVPNIKKFPNPPIMNGIKKLSRKQLPESSVSDVTME